VDSIQSKNNSGVVDNHIEHFEEVTTQFGQDYTEDLDYLLNSIQKNHLILDTALITKAFDLCYNSHIGIKRASGVAYYTHPLAVALIMIEELKLNETSLIIAALLHNVLRDNAQLDITQIRNTFGDKVTNLLISIEKIQKQSRNASRVQSDNPKAFYKLFLMIIRDIRIFVLQLCNRLHDIRTLQYLPKHNQVEIAQETLNFYVPFAFKLGFTKIQAELEVKAFYYYNPAQYQRIQEFLLFKRKVFTEFMYMLDDYIKQCLDRNNISYSISIKHKQEYEIFLLMQDGKKIEEIGSIFSLNVYIKTTDTLDCLNVGQILCEHLNKTNYIDVTLQPHIEINDDIIADLYCTCGKTQLIFCYN
jgi:(p)ppGpp synthase/HD superfamily hydrolase